MPKVSPVIHTKVQQTPPSWLGQMVRERHAQHLALQKQKSGTRKLRRTVGVLSGFAETKKQEVRFARERGFLRAFHDSYLPGWVKGRRGQTLDAKIFFNRGGFRVDLFMTWVASLVPEAAQKCLMADMKKKNNAQMLFKIGIGGASYALEIHLIGKLHTFSDLGQGNKEITGLFVSFLDPHALNIWKESAPRTKGLFWTEQHERRAQEEELRKHLLLRLRYPGHGGGFLDVEVFNTCNSRSALIVDHVLSDIFVSAVPPGCRVKSSRASLATAERKLIEGYTGMDFISGV